MIQGLQACTFLESNRVNIAVFGMAWYRYNQTSDLLSSKLKDKSIKIRIWKYKRFIHMRQIILRQTVGEKITNAALHFSSALVFEKASLWAVREE